MITLKFPATLLERMSVWPYVGRYYQYSGEKQTHEIPTSEKFNKTEKNQSEKFNKTEKNQSEKFNKKARKENEKFNKIEKTRSRNLTKTRNSTKTRNLTETRNSTKTRNLTETRNLTKYSTQNSTQIFLDSVKKCVEFSRYFGDGPLIP